MKLSNIQNQFKLSNGKQISFGIVKSLWNEEITQRLYDGCYETLLKYGAVKKNIITVNVPGSFELIYGAKKITEKSKLNAVIVIGSIIKGETPHFDFIANAVANGVKDLNIIYDIPFIFCVSTDLNKQQALERSGGNFGNKGSDSALTAISLINNIN
ncbi:MAG: 6,7-dimethyl-8-ribityllumazine synthase [Flavobacteriales bacterium]|nr:6,7-dimethyl-8-ribityllumazine synthase [Flavobacteriales bacterium]